MLRAARFRTSSTAATFSTAGQILRKKVTLQTIRKLRADRIPITVLTAHDYPSGILCEKAGVDVCLVGDSLAMEMIHHSKAVRRGCTAPFLVGDLPFGSYERSPEHALDSSIEYIRDGRVEAVKMEGGSELSTHVSLLTRFGIPCVGTFNTRIGLIKGHIGLTPQRQLMFGGFKVQGKTLDDAKRLVTDALELEEAGCQMLVLEAIPAPVAAFITSRLKIPTIGIGAGPTASGQVLVQMDALGMYDRFLPRFCKVYADVGKSSERALREYCGEVRSGTFPDSELHTYTMKSDEDALAFIEWSNQFKQ